MSRACSYCHTESPIYFQVIDYNRKITQEVFDYYRCPQCKLIFIWPIPDNLSAYYPREYHRVPKSVEDLSVVSKSEQYRIETVQRFVTCGRLLEIGPSYGSFTYLAKKAGYETEAIEMNKECCQFLNEVVGVNAVNSINPAEVLSHKEPYDVIALWHVIEHISNPWEILDAIYASLKPGGIIALATPNPEAFQFMVMGRYWPHIDAPRHVTLIPIKLVYEKLEFLGMKAELVTTNNQDSKSLNIFGWEYFFRKITLRRFFKKIFRLAGFLTSLLLSPIERIEGKGSAYTVVFRKPY